MKNKYDGLNIDARDRLDTIIRGCKAMEEQVYEEHPDLAVFLEGVIGHAQHATAAIDAYIESITG